MKISIFTNTFTPHVGGVANSVASLVDGMRARNHKIQVIAPEFDELPDGEKNVVRVPSIRNFNGTDFSFRLPSGTLIGDAIKAFNPDLIHSHHPFLLGDAGLRMAHEWHLPLVFTHHTRYENYVHYVLDESEWLERLAIELATEYANLCDLVIAPSESVRNLILDRGVRVPVEVVPTGIDWERFQNGEGRRIRDQLGVSQQGFLVGHVGRLAEEKNLKFLMKAVCRFLKDQTDAEFLVVGSGDLKSSLEELADNFGTAGRVHFLGKQTKQDLVDCYHAMDLFAFSSKSETQGMVLAEAMAAGVPVVALDASGARDIVEDAENGRLLPENSSEEDFAGVLTELRQKLEKEPDSMSGSISKTAQRFSQKACLDRMEVLYEKLTAGEYTKRDMNGWTRFINRIEAEWDLAQGKARAVGAAFKKSK